MKLKDEIQEVIAELKAVGIDLEMDFHALSFSQVYDILKAAERCGYRPSKNAPASRARMFYQFLQRRAK